MNADRPDPSMALAEADVIAAAFTSRDAYHEMNRNLSAGTLNASAASRERLFEALAALELARRLRGINA